MKAKELMTREIASCAPDTRLNDVVRIMWERDCGFVPVVDPASKEISGVVTDRDACMAAYTKGKALSDLIARDAMATKVWTCNHQDDLSAVHEAMRKHQIRRMVVVDDSGKPVGVLSLNDLALNAQKKGRGDAIEVASTLGKICKHRAQSRGRRGGRREAAAGEGM